MALLPTPVADNSRGLPSDGTDYQSLPNALVALLPTPAVNDMGAAYTPETWDEWTATMKAKHNDGNGHGKSLNVEAQRLLPTPTAQDASNNGGPSQFDRNTRPLNTEVLLLPTPSVADSMGGHERRGGERGEELLLKGVARAAAEGALLLTPTAMDSRGSGGNPDTTGTHGTTLTDATVRQPAKWGEYEPVIRRWETLTRPAPEPTKPNTKGSPKLSDEFDEWLMGYPAGWITDVPGVTWNEALKACGNGVVPQQGTAAIRWLVQMGQVAA